MEHLGRGWWAGVYQVKCCAQELAAWFERALYSITSSARWPVETLSDSDSTAGLKGQALADC
jgi:hypothetical protein